MSKSTQNLKTQSMIIEFMTFCVITFCMRNTEYENFVDYIFLIAVPTCINVQSNTLRVVGMMYFWIESLKL